MNKPKLYFVMRENPSLMCVSARTSCNVRVAQKMCETWKVCIRYSFPGKYRMDGRVGIDHCNDVCFHSMDNNCCRFPKILLLFP